MRTHVCVDSIRSAFSEALSAIYREEVPLYGELLDIINDVNDRSLAGQPVLWRQLPEAGELRRLGSERHGAIRVGTAEELSSMRRVFGVMGMHPVGYYDLSVAGVPVHSTGFRPIHPQALEACPFRVFTSLLRLELIADADLRAKAAQILARRNILSNRALELVDLAEREGGLTQSEADEFIPAVLEAFRWHDQAVVDAPTYQRLHDEHRLVADVVSFRGPHINHLTPRTLDIDKVQAEMLKRGIWAKDVIEGPPTREVPILLRQTSFNALKENVRFIGAADGEIGAHTARFGEIEQRGIALTRAGRELYDALLAEVREQQGSRGNDYRQRLAKAFEKFPDDLDVLRSQGLAYFHYELSCRGKLLIDSAWALGGELEDWIEEGFVVAKPVTYEDFLPVSAAGIFQSNLGGEEQRAYDGNSSQLAFEKALGARLYDPFDLYEKIEKDSRASIYAKTRGSIVVSR